jgi:hypothetical protein
MIIGIIIGIICYLAFKNFLLSIIIFYFTTGIWKTILWNDLISRDLGPIYLPPIIYTHHLAGILIWPIIVIHGDPVKDYYKDVQNGKAPPPKNNRFY